MIDVVKAQTIEQKREIVAHMRGYGDEHAEHVYGLYCDDRCIGGAAVVNNGPCSNFFHLGHSAKPSMALGKAMAEILSDLLSHYKQLTTAIALSNRASRKMARQLGFRVLYESDGLEHLVFDKTTWRYEKRWGI